MMIMKKTFVLLTLCCALMACKQNNIDFTFSPEAPRAGESVRFTNSSSTGEEWAWTFGDGSTSALKSPSHVYKKPGEYVVTLKVDNRSGWTKTAKVTVYDTIPTFVCEDSVFYIYKDYTFTANVYNPYNYEVKYEWNAADTTTDESSLTCYFTRPNDSAEVSLRVVLNDDTTYIKKRFYIEDRKVHSVLLRTAENDYRQRIFGDRAEKARPDATATGLLDAEQDTAQTYNGKDFRLSELVVIFPELQGFHIANRKIYYRAEGLWVASIDGANPVQIDAEPCIAMTLDTQDSRIYWANAQGVWYMPFVGSDNNKFVTVPTRLNGWTNVTKIAIDYNLK